MLITSTALLVSWSTYRAILRT